MVKKRIITLRKLLDGWGIRMKTAIIGQIIGGFISTFLFGWEIGLGVTIGLIIGTISIYTLIRILE